jgi:hypothetical protein
MKSRILLRAEMTLFKADAQHRANTFALTDLSIGCGIQAMGPLVGMAINLLKKKN